MADEIRSWQVVSSERFVELKAEESLVVKVPLIGGLLATKLTRSASNGDLEGYVVAGDTGIQVTAESGGLLDNITWELAITLVNSNTNSFRAVGTRTDDLTIPPTVVVHRVEGAVDPTDLPGTLDRIMAAFQDAEIARVNTEIDEASKIGTFASTLVARLEAWESIR